MQTYPEWMRGLNRAMEPSLFVSEVIGTVELFVTSFPLHTRNSPFLQSILDFPGWHADCSFEGKVTLEQLCRGECFLKGVVCLDHLFHLP